MKAAHWLNGFAEPRGVAVFMPGWSTKKPHEE